MKRLSDMLRDEGVREELINLIPSGKDAVIYPDRYTGYTDKNGEAVNLGDTVRDGDISYVLILKCCGGGYSLKSRRNGELRSIYNKVGLTNFTLIK